MKSNSNDLATLHAAMRNCRLCLEAGYEIFPRAIFSGVASASIMVIGQAPGITEKDAGRPFNAGSGTRLFQWLQEAGIGESSFRANQYMTSVTKCYPGRSGNSGDRVPSKAEQTFCRPFLDQELQCVDPSIILPVGRLAINLFFPARQPLTKIIGQAAQQDQRWIIPLPHPSGASRWHQTAKNRLLIDQAIGHLRRRLQSLS